MARPTTTILPSRWIATSLARAASWTLVWTMPSESNVVSSDPAGVSRVTPIWPLPMPTTMIFPSPWTATALAVASAPPSNRHSPPTPNVTSTEPSALTREAAAWVPNWPTATTLPSAWTATSCTSKVVPGKLIWAEPSPAKVVSRSPALMSVRFSSASNAGRADVPEGRARIGRSPIWVAPPAAARCAAHSSNGGSSGRDHRHAPSRRQLP